MLPSPVLAPTHHKSHPLNILSNSLSPQAKALPAETLAQLPAPGEVEFIMGGPPCQGYSGGGDSSSASAAQHSA